MKFCFKPARNFRTVEPFNSFLPPTPRKPANWTKHVGDYAGRFSSIRGLPSWRKPIQIWSRSETIEQELASCPPALDCYFGDRPLHSEFCIIMEIDFQAIQTDKLKTRIGELRRYL